MFKVNNNFEHILHLGVSIVNFEQVNAGWVGTCFAQSTINSINPFHGTSQGLWIKGSPLWYLVTGSSLFLKKISQNDHSLLFVVPGCTTRCSWFYHSLSLAVTRCTTRCHSLPLFAIPCHFLYHLLSLVFSRCMTRLFFLLTFSFHHFILNHCFVHCSCLAA